MSMFDNRKYARHLCECELCNEWAKLGKRFVHNHHRKGKHHSEESKRKTSKSLMNHTVSEEAKKKMSKSQKGRNKGKTWEEICGVECAKERRRKWSESKKGETYYTLVCSYCEKGYTNTHKEQKYCSKKCFHLSERGDRNPAKRPEVGKKISKSAKKRWQNPEFREKQLKAIFVGRDMRPTKPERKLRNRLNHLFPREYKYVGNGDIWIGGKNPDFININGQKKIIEMFGDFWHSKKYTGRTKRQEENRRIKHFAKYGFGTLIVWQRELKDIEQLNKKIVAFNRL